ncbi:splicing regulator RBM11 [Rhinatrema bivittatum]|uniref:splicing regulator RBM11 n=1 Tax=Rhinatrema bivittatum TaxID=194408 RepID=UPI0011267F8B|nr:splicing regulator RBM11 [Rhinatrema bivittatum]
MWMYLTMFRTQDEKDRTIFVGNLDSGVKEEILYELFLQAGPLIKVNIVKDKEGNPKSFGFVCFKHTESVPYAIALLNGIRLYGRPIKLAYRSGSCHASESNSPYQASENSSNRNVAAYRSDGLPDQCSFPATSSPVENSLFSQACLYFQGMMNYFVTQQQSSAYGQAAQPTPYYQNIPQQTPNVPATPYPSPGQHVTAGPGSLEWSIQSLREQELHQNVELTRKRKRQQLTSDSDSGTERMGSRSQTEHGQKYRHCQGKKTKYS